MKRPKLIVVITTLGVAVCAILILFYCGSITNYSLDAPSKILCTASCVDSNGNLIIGDSTGVVHIIDPNSSFRHKIPIAREISSVLRIGKATIVIDYFGHIYRISDQYSAMGIGRVKHYVASASSNERFLVMAPGAQSDKIYIYKNNAVDGSEIAGDFLNVSVDADGVNVVSMISDSDIAAIGTYSGQLSTFDIHSQKVTPVATFALRVRCIASNKLGHIACFSADGTLFYYSLHDKTVLLKLLCNHEYNALLIDDGSTLYAAGGVGFGTPGYIHKYSVSSGYVGEIKHSCVGGIETMCASKFGDSLLVAGYGNKFSIVSVVSFRK